MMSRRSVLAVAIATGVVASASGVRCADADVMPIARRTAGMLASDLTLDAVYLLRDLDGDGVASSPGEVTVFFDGSNASGLPSPTGSIFAMFQTADGTVYLGDGDTDTVYAVKDLNGDGDALDAGEARVWFSGFNASLIPLPTPGGICQGADGAIYITNAGTSSSPQEGLIRTIDLNGDGNANGAGEQSFFVDTFAIGVASSNPFECCLLNGKVHFLDPRGSASNVIFVADDSDGDGTVSALELKTFFDDSVIPAPSDFSCQSDGTSIYIHESTSSQVQSVWRLTDLDGSGRIDQSSEAVQIWTETSLPMGASMGNSFSITLGPGMIALSSNGTDAQDAVFIARDLNSDGDYDDAGGTSVFAQGDATVAFPENIRSLLFYGEPCRADINNSGTVTVQDIFDFLGFYFSSDPRADINGSGSVTVQDIFDFLALYFAGC